MNSFSSPKPAPHPSQTPRKKTCGFTLVELLVVIAVISVLAGLLLPALQSAVGMSRSVQCVSQMKQIGIASSLYADNNENHYPSVYSEDGSMFQTKLNPDLGVNAKFSYFDGRNPVWWCPSATKTTPSLHYGLNGHMGDARWGRRVNAPPRPSEIFILLEMNRNAQVVWSTASPSFSGSTVCAYRISHLGNSSANYLYGDNHIEPHYGNRNRLVDQTYKKHWFWW